MLKVAVHKLFLKNLMDVLGLLQRRSPYEFSLHMPENETAVRRMKSTSDAMTATANPISPIRPTRFMSPPDART